eukprot:9359302-Alexandrium_andersonii.AAC.1
MALALRTGMCWDPSPGCRFRKPYDVEHTGLLSREGRAAHPCLERAHARTQPSTHVRRRTCADGTHGSLEQA